MDGRKAVLKLEGVAKRFGSQRHPVRALEDVSFEVEKGEVVALVGPSGSGKTTVLQLIAGLLSADSGTAHFEGRILPLTETSRGREKMSLVFQDPYASLSPFFRVGEILMEPLRLRGKYTEKEQQRRIREALAKVSLVPPEAYLSRRPTHLSGGQRQRVAIARALLTDPVLLIADEPSSMLDVSTGVEILNLFRRMADAGTSICLSVHDMASACYVADRVMVISEGRVVEKTTPEAIIAGSCHPLARFPVEVSNSRDE